MYSSVNAVKISSLFTLSLWKRLATVSLIATLIFGAILFGSDYEYQRQLAAISERGEPISFAELPEYYGEIPSEDDTRAIWNQARQKSGEIRAKMSPEEKVRFEEFPSHEFYKTEDENLQLNKSWKFLPLTNDYIPPRVEVLNLIRAAAANGGRTNPRQIKAETFFDDSTRNLIDQSELRRTLWVTILFELSVRHPDQAAARIADLGAFYQSEVNEPAVIHGLIRVGIFMSLCRAIEALCNQSKIAGDDLALCQQVLSKIDFKTDLRHTLVTERVFGIESFARDLAHPFSSKTNWFATFFERPRYLGLYASLLIEIEKSWPEIALYCDEIDAEWTMESTAVSAFGAAKSTTERFVFAEAFLRLAQTSLAIRQFANQHHRAPNALDELVPGQMKNVPENPLTGKRIQYSVDKDGVVVLVVDGSLFLDREPVGLSEEVRPKEITFRIRVPKTDSPE